MYCMSKFYNHVIIMHCNEVLHKRYYSTFMFMFQKKVQSMHLHVLVV